MVTSEQLNVLYPYERRVLSLIAQGKTNPEIADMLGISPRSARTYAWKIKSKVGALSRVEMMDLSEEEMEHMREEKKAKRGLSGKELEALRLLACGHNDRAIASTLKISKHAATARIESVKEKLGIQSRVSLALYVVKEGIVSIDEDKEHNND